MFSPSSHSSRLVYLNGVLLVLAEVTEHKRGALAGEGLRNGVSQAPFVGDAQDQGSFALQ